jgi:hypothetical protein
MRAAMETLVAFVALCAPLQDASIEVRVDPRVELMTTLARLAGFPEFTQASTASPYAEEIDFHFGEFHDHPAVASLVRLRAASGVSFDAISSLAVHLGPLPELEEHVPFDRSPERLDGRWGFTLSRGFLDELRDFVEVSDAAVWFEEQRPYYAEVERRLAARLAESKALPWFDAFFGARAARYTAIPGLLCGGGNYGVGVRHPDGQQEEITPVFGCWSWDAEGFPVFGPEYLPLFVHEPRHSSPHRFADQVADELAESCARSHAANAEAMKRQAYGNWRTLAYESHVRASVIRCRRATEGEAAARQQEREEVAKHFEWVPELAALFGEFEAERERYPDFAAFLPRIVGFFDAYAATLPSEEAAAPKLVSIVPANGATDVDPALTQMVITFDRPMQSGSWSIVGAKEDAPEVAGALAYDAEGKVLTVPVRLVPGRTYRFGLNSAAFSGFQSADGIALAPVEVRFTTRP